ncbi:hypothetical protein E4U14_007400 [Claviceps sp. LM454 group G7]|nr:hypothetical protein E4U14_007400 [Claviceps sp. LM454 group G7]
MADLTEDERGIISENSLGHSLDDVREALRNAEGDAQGEAWLGAVSQLFTALFASRACLRLASRIENRYYLMSNLGLIATRLQKHELPIQVFRPLSQLVLNQASDIDIWTAVISLVDSVVESARPSIPTRIPKTIPALPNMGTQLTFRSHLDQSTPSSRTQVEEQINFELEDCCDKEVKGFDEKYFQGREWNSRAEEVWQEAKSRYSISNHRWLNLPDDPDEETFCTWLLGLQEDFLNSERTAYYRSDTKNMIGPEDQRQVDILVKMKTKGGRKHVWPDLLALAECKSCHKVDGKNLFLQLGSAVRNLFASQPTRQFVHGFTFSGTDIRAWVFDRSGAYSATKFNIHEHPEKFFRMLCGYLMMSDDELGLDTFIQHKDGKMIVTMPVNINKPELTELELRPGPIAHQRAIICRATTCFLAKPSDAPKDAKWDRVVKFSWTSSMRRPEAELLNEAEERDIKGIARVVGYKERIVSISSLRAGLQFPATRAYRASSGKRKSISLSYSLPTSSAKRPATGSLSGTRPPRRARRASYASTMSSIAGPSSYATPGQRSGGNLADSTRARPDIEDPAQDPEGSDSLARQNETPYDDRILRVLVVSPAGDPLVEYKSILELLECLHDAIKAHRSLYMDSKILHRDISVNNIIITDPSKADGYKGVLIDLDLAQNMNEGPSGARFRTGTIEFMAIGVLLGEQHTYRHDLESFFYVFVWLCFVYGPKGKGKKPTNALPGWSIVRGDFKDMAKAKFADVGFGFNSFMRDYPAVCGECVKQFITTIHDILFKVPPGVGVDPHEYTPEEPDDMYEPILEAFEKTIREIREQG